MSRRVVITACSAISPIGYGKKDIVAALKAGVSGVKPLRDDGLLANRIHSKVFGTVDYPVPLDFPRQFRKTMGPVANYACKVAGDVLAGGALGRGAAHDHILDLAHVDSGAFDQSLNHQTPQLHRRVAR